MFLYTPKEIQEDIFAFEKCKTDLNTDKPFFLTKLYSEEYESPLTNNNTVDDLNKRINDYVKKYAILKIIEPIDDQHAFNVYARNNSVDDLTRVFVGNTEEDMERFYRFINDTLFTEIYIVYTETKEVFMKVRVVH